jgi:hypothetical protein
VDRPAALLTAFLAASSASVAGADRPPRAEARRAPTPETAPPANGLAFALALKGSGEVLASGPFLLRIPGGTGPLRLELARLTVNGARLSGEARLRNESGLLLSGLELDLRSATATNGAVPGRSAASPVPLSLREPLALGELLPGEATPFVPFEVAPLPLGEEVALTTLLGAVSGLAVESPFAVDGALDPVALDSDRSGRLYVATGGVGRVLRLNPSPTSSPAEAARPSAPPTGLAVRKKDGALLVATGGSAIEVHRAGRSRPATLDAGRAVSSLRVDAKNVLRAVSGNGVLEFDEAKPGAPQALGPDGSAVLSFDAAPDGRLWAIVEDGAARRLVTSAPRGTTPLVAGRGAGADALDAPVVVRLGADGALWVAAEARSPEGAVVTRFRDDGTPLGTFPRLALALLLGKDEDAAVPAVVDLAPGTEGRLWVLFESGTLVALRPL